MIVGIEIETDRLVIAPFSESLLTAKYVSWLNNPDIVMNSRQRHVEHTLASCQSYFKSFATSDNLFLAIRLKNDSFEHIGNITVTIDKTNSVADIAILIGAQAYWGNGYGAEAWIAVCDYLLYDLGFRKVTGGCYDTNESMKKIMLKANMHPDGIRKKQVIVNKKPVDIVHYALFNNSWSSYE